jgi:hypothetical protein
MHERETCLDKLGARGSVHMENKEVHETVVLLRPNVAGRRWIERAPCSPGRRTG